MTSTPVDVINSCKNSLLTGQDFRQMCMAALQELPGYDWAGVYRLEMDTLILDAFVGEATDHTCIPVGMGVCGTAVALEKNQVVRDVSQLENYLSCNLETKSEIVVLIRKDGKIIGQIDIDSHQVGAFGEEDERFLESLAVLISDRWETN